MIIRDPQLRNERTKEKRRLLLRFLREEVYTSPLVAALVMNCGVRAAQQTVTSLEKDGLVKRHQVKILENLPPASIIGITTHGQAMAFLPEKGEVPVGRIFEPKKYSLVGLQHKLDLQRVRILLTKKGYVTGWTPGELLEVEKGDQRPDALAELARGDRIAIELERTLKSQKRYRTIALGHFGAFMSGKISGVAYVCPDRSTAVRVCAMFLEPWRRHGGEENTEQAEAFLNSVLFTHYENLTADFALQFFNVLEGL